MTDSQQQTHVDGQHDNHGNSVAAWTAVSLIMLGGLIASIAVAAVSLWLGIVGVVVVVVGAVSAKVLSAMGFGASGKPAH